MDLSGRWFRVGGLLVAGIGFATTRLFVVEAVQTDTTLSFLFAGILPLSLGLGLVAYGIGLAVGSFSREYVLTVTQWCLLGTGASASILLVTSFDSMMEPGSFRLLAGSPLLTANVLLGGSIGGVLVGNRSATTHQQQRQIQRQANRALLLDRLLRHEVINAVNIIRGNATLLANGENAGGGIDTIESASERITSTIEEVGTLIEENDTAASVDVAAILATETASLDEAFPEVDATYEGPTEGLDAAVDERIRIVFRELLENAAEDDDTTCIEAGVAATNHEVRITVSDDGSGLPDQQRDLLVSGAFPEYDDPSSGFGLQIVRLLVLAYGGQITVEDGIDGAGTTVAVTLPRIDVDGDIVRSVGVSVRNLYWAILTGLFAGVAMGVFFVVATDVLPVIGALYGVQSPLIGMVTHLFHSVIFALIYAGACARPSLTEWLSGPLRGGVAGVVWGTMLWLVAAGVIMPLLLRGVGLMAALPNLPAVGFVSHAIWGGLLGVSYALVRDRPVPWLE